MDFGLWSIECRVNSIKCRVESKQDRDNITLFG